MKIVVTCPACNATNKPRAVTCRVCGQRLVESRTKGGMREPVVLQRVMTGEVFSAVVVPGEGAIPVKDPRRPALTPTSAPEKTAAPAAAPGRLTDSDVSKLLREILRLAPRADYAQAVAAPDRTPATLLRVDLEKRKSTEAVRAVADEIARELEEIEGRARDRAAEPDAFDPDATPEAVFASISEPAAVPAPARPVAAEARAR